MMVCSNDPDRHINIPIPVAKLALLVHANILTTERYCRVSNQKVRRDYYRAMGKVIQRHSLLREKTLDKEDILINLNSS